MSGMMMPPEVQAPMTSDASALAPTGPEPGRADVRQAVLRSRTSVEEGLVAEDEFLGALAEREQSFVLPGVPSGYLEPVTDAIPAAYMEEFLLVPFYRDPRGAVWTAIARDLDDGTRRELRRVLGGRIETVAAPKSAILELIRSIYPEAGASAAPDEAAAAEDIESLAQQAPVVRLVNFIIQEAFRKQASDIHLEAMEDELKVRYRIDGALHDITQPPKAYQAAVISRIKLLADLDITERRRPQDGRIKMEVDARPIDLRVSTIPTVHGESVALRILDKESIRIPLESLGFAPTVLSRFHRTIRSSHGIILTTGPTGSGKTTTQYAALEKLNRPDTKIITVEDPVEYHLEGINQMPVAPKIGLTFSSALRSILRQDPDVIMVGEMRDVDTAQIAIQAALTGHLVFSTLHTNDAASAVTRLLEMGIEDYLVSSTLVAILAQRLARKVCASCARPVSLDEEPEAARELLGGDGPVTLRRGRGCGACDGTGYRGRTGLFELLAMDEGVRGAIATEVLSDRTDRIRDAARAGGMRTLREDGLDKVRAGVTTLEEVLRLTDTET